MQRTHGTNKLAIDLTPHSVELELRGWCAGDTALVLWHTTASGTQMAAVHWTLRLDADIDRVTRECEFRPSIPEYSMSD